MIPSILTTTQVQRNPKLLEIKDIYGYTLITKNGEPISALVSIKKLEQINQGVNYLQEPKRLKKIPDSIKDIFQDVDPLEYQRNIRDEE